MENNKLKYLSRDEYWEEFKKNGGEDILSFLVEKIKEARASGDKELEMHISRIYESYELGQAYAEWEETLKTLGISEMKQQYEDMLAQIEKYDREYLSPSESTEELETNRFETEQLEQKSNILKYRIKMEELRTSTIQMTPEEREKEYNKLLEERQNLSDMEYHGMMGIIQPLDFVFIDDALELIKGTKENEKATGQSQEDDLSLLSVEELIERFNSNNQTITNNEQVIKQALIKRILEQQQQITEQNVEIDRLQGQKEL